MATISNKDKKSTAPTKSMIRRTTVLIAVCGIVAFLVLAVRLYKIQVIDHDYYESLALSQQVRETESDANRGTIYDRNMKVLAMSTDVYNVFISPAEILKHNDDINVIASGLSEILGIDYQTVIEKNSNPESWYQIVAKKVEDDVAQKVTDFKKENDILGIHLESTTKRYYPYNDLACHVIGFVGDENTGLSGVEYEYNDVLTGSEGRTVRSVTANNKDLLYTDFEDYYDSEDGYNTVLTIDATVQYYIEKHLQQAVEDYDIQSGAGAIAMNVNTGEILGMVSINGFDLNNYLDVSDEIQELADEAETDDESNQIIADARNAQWKNKCITDTYEPGSTFKIITLAMALQEGVVSDASSFYCGGSIQVIGDDEARNCWNTDGHGTQTLTQAVQHSCNVAFVQIGQKIGAKNFYRYCDDFGLLNETNNPDATLTAKTGIDLQGESGSIWWSQNTFFNPEVKSQLAAASFGQTFTITPLQLITAVSACVNGGNLMQPYVVKQLTDEDGNVVYNKEPSVVRQVISEETSNKVCSILEQVVGDPVDGTGKNAYVAGYRIGGKTGTSEKVSKLAATGVKDYIVSFIGFAPADNPQVALLVFLDSPSQSSGIYISGGQMAAPVVGQMFEDILPYLGVEAQYSEEEKANLDKSVPSVEGLSVDEAERLLESEGFKYRILGGGSTISDQLPKAHSIIAAGSTVLIYADSSPSEDVEEMIDLKDLTYAIARDRLSYYGLFINTSSSIIDPEHQRVVSQSIEIGKDVEHGTVINVTLANNDSSMLGRY